MALELRQSLTLTQQLVMTPQLQQAIKLLQLSRLELVETINEEMEENPVLEEQLSGDSDEQPKDDEGDVDKTEQEPPELVEITVDEKTPDDVDWDNYLSEYNTERTSAPFEEREAPAIDNIISASTNLYSHLMWQLGMADPDDEQKKICAEATLRLFAHRPWQEHDRKPRQDTE